MKGKGYFFPAAMALIAIFCFTLPLYAGSTEGVWILGAIASAAGIINAVRNKWKFKKWFTEQA